MKKEQGKRIIGNTAYTMGGMLFMNGVLQLMIYPLLNRTMGETELGNVLYIMGIVGILCPSVGQALNASRLVVRRTTKVTNGDYNMLVLLFGGIGSVIAIFLSGSNIRGMGTILLTFVLLMLTTYRYYGDVEYRLNLNYQKFFIYYLLMGIGYGIGFLLFWQMGNWFLIFLTGEGLALIYLALTGSIFNEFWKRGEGFKKAAVRGLVLTLSYLITNTTFNMDRLVLKNLIGPDAVTWYYVTSLIGKTLVLLVAPVNTIVISYLTKRERTLNRKEYTVGVLAGLGVAAAFFLCCQIGTPIFIRLFYPGLYEQVQGLVTVVNLTQILALLSAFLFILVLTFTAEKWQLILQVGHLILMIALVVPAAMKWGIQGYANGALAANAVRTAGVIVLGYASCGRRKKDRKDKE